VSQAFPSPRIARAQAHRVGFSFRADASLISPSVVSGKLSKQASIIQLRR